MELKVDEIQLPDVIRFNYEELKAELAETMQFYETVVYTDEQIKDAKADRAKLNKLKAALKDERIKRKKEYLKPFEDFEKKITEIIEIIDKPVALIDTQIKDFEEKEKAAKRQEIGAYWTSIEHPDWLTLPKIFYEGWLKKSYSMKQIKSDIDAWVERVNTDIATLENLDEFSFEAIDEYKRTLDINKAIAEGHRLADIQKRKEQAQAEAKAAAEEMAAGYEAGINAAEFMTPPTDAEQPEANAEPVAGQWVKFAALLTVDQAQKLKAFFKENNIEFKAI